MIVVRVEEKRMNLYGWTRAGGGGNRPDGKPRVAERLTYLRFPIQVTVHYNQLFYCSTFNPEPHRLNTAPTTLNQLVQLVKDRISQSNILWPMLNRP